MKKIFNSQVNLKKIILILEENEYSLLNQKELREEILNFKWELNIKSNIKMNNIKKNFKDIDVKVKKINDGRYCISDGNNDLKENIKNNKYKGEKLFNNVILKDEISIYRLNFSHEEKIIPIKKKMIENLTGMNKRLKRGTKTNENINNFALQSNNHEGTLKDLIDKVSTRIENENLENTPIKKRKIVNLKSEIARIKKIVIVKIQINNKPDFIFSTSFPKKNLSSLPDVKVVDNCVKREDDDFYYSSMSKHQSDKLQENFFNNCKDETDQRMTIENKKNNESCEFENKNPRSMTLNKFDGFLKFRKVVSGDRDENYDNCEKCKKIKVLSDLYASINPYYAYCDEISLNLLVDIIENPSDSDFFSCLESFDDNDKVFYDITDDNCGIDNDFDEDCEILDNIDDDCDINDVSGIVINKFCYEDKTKHYEDITDDDDDAHCFYEIINDDVDCFYEIIDDEDVDEKKDDCDKVGDESGNKP
ncbi:hypothetical protein DMUE_3491 [Dictyocoela muelleri]|nr:hypothetical protein DMUE_3491 [Dictyocoela muelleri]